MLAVFLICLLHVRPDMDQTAPYALLQVLRGQMGEHALKLVYESQFRAHLSSGCTLCKLTVWRCASRVATAGVLLSPFRHEAQQVALTLKPRVHQTDL